MAIKYDEPQDIWEGIQPCALHGQAETNHECAGCKAEMVAREARIEQMSAACTDKLQGIANQGGPMIPPHIPIQVQMEVLLESVFQDPRQRLQFEGEVGRRIMLMIKNMQEQIKQPTLHVVKNGGLQT